MLERSVGGGGLDSILARLVHLLLHHVDPTIAVMISRLLQDLLTSTQKTRATLYSVELLLGVMLT